MCYVCGSSPHISSCPFSKKTSHIKCAVCGYSIFEDDIFYILNNENFHKDCLKELNGMDVIEVLEIKPQ